MQEALLFCFNLKKSAAEPHRMLVEAYGDNALSETTCRDWFRRFNDDNFDLSETRSVKIGPGRLRIVQLQALLDGDDTQSQKMLAEQLGVSQAASQAISMWLHAMEEVQKIGKWVTHELNDRQMDDAKTHAKFCLPDKKESRSIGL